ncbi:MAG: hypothetical protein ACREXY_23985, partial [Gammaproteobacteria bacterium]
MNNFNVYRLLDGVKRIVALRGFVWGDFRENSRVSAVTCSSSFYGPLESDMVAQATAPHAGLKGQLPERRVSA